MKGFEPPLPKETPFEDAAFTKFRHIGQIKNPGNKKYTRFYFYFIVYILKGDT